MGKSVDSVVSEVSGIRGRWNTSSSDGGGVPVSQNPVGSAPQTFSGSDRRSSFLDHDPH